MLCRLLSAYAKIMKMDDDYEGGDGYYADESGEAPGSYTPRRLLRRTPSAQLFRLINTSKMC